MRKIIPGRTGLCPRCSIQADVNEHPGTPIKAKNAYVFICVHLRSFAFSFSLMQIANMARSYKVSESAYA
jgi:uncharacterized paraquat-inducible protein A